jgi:succinate dehydrogenase / fumarate reductase cytochrome b subunit
MTRLFNLVLTSLGSKIVVAVTGLGLSGFVVFHMLGNLQVFEGPDAINTYAAFLRELPILLWSARIGLFLIAALHVGLTIRLAIHNRQARPEPYAVRDYRTASLSSRTMALTGSVLLLFIIFHLLHFTAGAVDTSFADRLDPRGHRDVYAKVIHAFQNPLFVVLYLAAQGLLGLHVSHGVSSSLQTLGLDHPLLNRLFRAAGPLVGGIVVLGNVAIVLAIALGVLRA